MSPAEKLTPIPRLWEGDPSDRDNYEIIDGIRVELPPMSADSQALASQLARHLSNYGIEKQIGEAYVEIIFKLQLPVDRNRRPDVAFVPYSRWAKNRPIPSTNEWNILPDLFVEIISPNDDAEEIETKVTEYFDSGARQVWVVYPRHKRFYVYESMQLVRRLCRSDTLDGGPVLPGFLLPLVELFPDPPAA
jgi:Uma2 family endonuclease